MNGNAVALRLVCVGNVVLGLKPKATRCRRSATQPHWGRTNYLGLKSKAKQCRRSAIRMRWECGPWVKTQGY